MREMKPKIGEGILKEHLAAPNERKSLAPDQLYPREMKEPVQYGPTLLSVVFEGLVNTGDGQMSSQFSKVGRSHCTGFRLFLLKSISGEGAKEYLLTKTTESANLCLYHSLFLGWIHGPGLVV